MSFNDFSPISLNISLEKKAAKEQVLAARWGRFTSLEDPRSLIPANRYVLNVSIYWKALACEIDYIYYFDTVVLKSCLIWIPFTGVNMKISVGLSGRSNVASPLYRPGNHNVCQLECNSLHGLLYQRLGESSAGVGGSEQLAWPRSGVILRLIRWKTYSYKQTDTQRCEGSR